MCALILFLCSRNSPTADQEALLDLLWKLWPQLPAYGRKAAQFVDLLGYFSLKTTQTGRKVGLEVQFIGELLHFYFKQLLSRVAVSIERFPASGT